MFEPHPWQVVVVYILLLYPCREPILLGKKTALVSATTFLTHDYESHIFFWEPLELIRRTALTGWVRNVQYLFSSLRGVARCVGHLEPLELTLPVAARWQVLLIHEDNSFVRLLVSLIIP